MLTYTQRSIDDRLAAAHLAVTNALADPGLLALLAQRSYTEARLNEGKALVEQARLLQAKVQRHRGLQYGSTDALKAAWGAAQRAHRTHIELTRVALAGNRNLQEQLGVLGARSRTVVAWVEQARHFYRNALASAEARALLEPFGLDQATLEAGLAQVEMVESTRAQQVHLRGEAQDAAGRSKAAMAELDAWMKTFLRVARVALQDRPQWLEKLGILARS